jgi:predicted nuclease with RNAse H fold
MFFIGIDLSGPVNTEDTAITCFRAVSGRLELDRWQTAVTDQAIFDFVVDCQKAGKLIIALDAPLSYNPGGGDRQADRQLRQLVVEAGLSSGAVMTPTMTRMAYLTLRGIHLAHNLRMLDTHNIEVLETHPGAVMALNGAPVELVRRLKSDVEARNDLLQWLEGQGMAGVTKLVNANDHLVASCACALGAWNWYKQESSWTYAPHPPLHPFAFTC